MAHFNSSEQLMNFERGFVIDLDLQTGLSKMLDIRQQNTCQIHSI